MPAASLPENENFRLQELHNLRILDTAAEAFFEHVVDQVVAVSGAPIAAVSLVDKDRQWFKAYRGLNLNQTPREDAFCAHTILDTDILVVTNAERDARFCDNRLVCSDTHLRAYAGAPIILDNGAIIGSICAIDTSPKQWNGLTLGVLRRLAEMVAVHLQSRVAVANAEHEVELARELAQTRLKYQTVVQSMVEGVTLIGRDGEILEANAAALNILGFTVDEMTGKTTADPSWRSEFEDGRPMPVEQMPVSRALSTGQTVKDGLLAVVTGAGDRRLLSVNAVPLFAEEDPLPSAVVGTFADITLRRQREEELAQARDEAEAASASKTVFLDSMAHEVRTPLNGMLGLVQHIQRADVSDAVRDSLDLILKSGLHLKAIVDDALDLGRMDAGQLNIKLGDVDLADCMEEVVALGTAQAEMLGRSSKLSIVSDMSSDSRVKVRSDGLRLRQILHNLISNAVKFTDEGEIRVEASLSHDTADVTELAVRVADTGAGVPESFRAQLFRRFSRAETSDARSTQGAGLGLNLSQRIANLLGGQILFEPNQPRGSVFTVKLPVNLTDRGGINQESRGEDGLPEGLKILLADDHSINHQVICALLSPFNPKIVSANCGKEALQFGLSQEFDLILLDLRMPGLSGLEVLERLRAAERAQARARTPVLCVTALDNPDTLELLHDRGFDGIVEKPILVSRLIEQIRDATSRCHDTDEWAVDGGASAA